MTAREMFEKLGYTLVADDDGQILYTNLHTGSMFRFIKSIKAYEGVSHGMVMLFGVVSHKAIHQQLLELGWLDVD